MTSAILLEKKPRGATRSKYSYTALLVIFGLFCLAEPSNRSLNGFLLTLYCGIAIALAATSVKEMWALNARRIPQWASALLIVGGTAATVGLMVLDDKKIFVWNQLYLLLPMWIFFGLMSMAAWFVEWRKPALIYDTLEGLAFVHPPAPPLSRTKRLVLVACALILVWGVFAFVHDERLDDGFNAFYFPARPAVKDNENVAIGIAGLSAPSGTNVVEYGRTALDARQSFLPGGAARLEARGKLAFVGSNSELQCLDESTPPPTGIKCASDDRINELLHRNAELLSRYRQVYRLPYVSENAHNNAVEITLNKLIAHEVRLDLRQGRAEIAYEKWRDNQKFLRRMDAEDGTWVDKAFSLVMESISLSTAAVLIQTTPKLANEHYQEIKELVSPGGMASYNIAGVMRAEYLVFDLQYGHPESLKSWVHPGFIRNRFFRSAKDYLRVSQAPPADVAKEANAIWLSHTSGWSADYLLDPMNAMWSRVLLGGQLKTGNMLEQMYLQDGQRRLLVLRLEILHRGIPDKEVEAFLQNADHGLRDPFTGDAMRWDAVKRSIYFKYAGDNEYTKEVRL